MNEFLKELADLLEKYNAEIWPTEGEMTIYIGDNDHLELNEPIFGAEEAYGYSLIS